MTKMLDMLRAMNAYTEHDSGGVEELAQAANEPVCAITGCDEWPVTTCVCCNRDVCSYDIAGADETGPGICSDCLFKCADGLICKVVSHE